MKKYLYILVASFLFIGCAKKSSNINISIPQNTSSEIRDALKSYNNMKKDRSIEKIVPVESYKASKLAEMLLDNIDDPKLSKHYAYLLKNQIQIAKLAKKRIQKVSELNNIIIQRNEAIAEMKKEMKEDENSNSEGDIVINEQDESNLKKIFQYHDNSFTINSKYFDNDELIPNRNLRKFIVYLANFLHNNPSKSLELLSYTDGVGSESYSIDLSLRRANRVKEMLVDNNVEEDRVIVKPKGATEFLASNDDKDGRIQNNRIVVNIK